MENKVPLAKSKASDGTIALVSKNTKNRGGGSCG